MASRVRRGALLISATISMSHAPYSRASSDRPKWRGMSRRSLGPFSTRTPTLVRHGRGVTLAQTRDHHQVGSLRHGQRTRDPGRGHQCGNGDLEDGHVIVERRRHLGEHAAERRLRQLAGDEQDALRRVTTGRSGRTGPRASIIPAGRRSARTCSACPRGPRPPSAATTPRPRSSAPARSPCR